MLGFSLLYFLESEHQPTKQIPVEHSHTISYLPPMPSTIITDRQIVTANAFQRRMIEKLYDTSVYENTIVENITYLSGGLKVKGYVASPKEAGSYPVLLWNRGGYKDGGAIEDLTSFLILASTALWGYVVVASQYRGNMGGEREADFGGKDLDDALTMLDVAKEYPQADLSRVAIEGASRGGMTTYRALAREHRFKCAMIHAGISDIFALEKEDERFAKLVDKITTDLSPDERTTKLSSLSGVYIAEQFDKKCPILLMHGTDDEAVSISHSEAMAKELTRLEHPHEFKIIENGGHISLKDGSYKEIDVLRKAWLAKYL